MARADVDDHDAETHGGEGRGWSVGEQAELLQEHLDIPIKRAEDTQRGVDGVCIATTGANKAKYDIPYGAAERAAMLVPQSWETPEERSPSCGRSTTACDEAADQDISANRAAPNGVQTAGGWGKAPATTPMQTLVLEIPRAVSANEADWRNVV